VFSPYTPLDDADPVLPWTPFAAPVFTTFRTPPLLTAPVCRIPLRRKRVESRSSMRSTLRLATLACVLTFSAAWFGAATRLSGADAASVSVLITCSALPATGAVRFVVVLALLPWPRMKLSPVAA
jgi:hypothetical protein